MAGQPEKAASYIEFLPPTEPLNAKIKAKLTETFGDDELNGLAGSIPGSILPRIKAAMPDQEAKWLPIAIALISGLQDMGFGKDETAALTTPTSPQRLVVEMPKQLGELSTRELLDKLATGESDANEVLEYLMAKPDVVKASRVANGKIAILTKDGNLDVTATIDYIKRLGRAFPETERLINGQAPTTLDRALKRSEMVTLNPYMGAVEYVGTRNKYGIVMSDVPDERYQAIAWAAQSGHRFMPKVTDDEFDLIRFHEELFTTDGARGKRIEEDYKLAKQTGDASTLVTVPRQMTEDQALQLLGRPGSTSNQPTTAPREVNWEDVVRRHFAKVEELSSTSRRIGGHNKTVTGCFTRLSVDGHNIHLNNVVVIGQLSIDGHNIRGTAYMPPRRSANEGGHNNHVVVTNVTWEEIARLIDARP